MFPEGLQMSHYKEIGSETQTKLFVTLVLAKFDVLILIIEYNNFKLSLSLITWPIKIDRNRITNEKKIYICHISQNFEISGWQVPHPFS